MLLNGNDDVVQQPILAVAVSTVLSVAAMSKQLEFRGTTDAAFREGREVIDTANVAPRRLCITVRHVRR